MQTDKKLKIAHVTYSLTIGGVTNVIRQLLERKSEDAEQILVLLSTTEEIPADLAGIKTYRLNYNLPEEYTLSGFAKLWLQPKKYYGEVVSRLKEIQEQEQFDIYHFHGIPKDLPIGKILQETSKIKLVYTDHLMRISNEERGVKTKLLSFIYKQFYKSYNVIFVSQAIYNRAKQLGFVNASNKNEVIENSIDAAKVVVKKTYTIADKINIVYVSRISAVKGHFSLLPVAELLVNKYKLSNFRFVLIGPGELTEQLQAAITSRNLDTYFQLRGPLQNVPALLGEFDIAVFPSEREGLPVALLEKMAAGLPVVASDIPEIKNVIKNTGEALIYPLNNAEACAEELYKLIQSPDLREKTGAAARQAVKERYSTPLLERYLAFYKGLA